MSLSLHPDMPMTAGAFAQRVFQKLTGRAALARCAPLLLPVIGLGARWAFERWRCGRQAIEDPRHFGDLLIVHVDRLAAALADDLPRDSWLDDHILRRRVAVVVVREVAAPRRG